MQLFNTPAGNIVDLEKKVLLSGSSLVFDQNFTTAYNFKNFLIEHELLDEEVAQRIKRIRINENGNLELKFLHVPKIIAYVFEKITPFNLTHSNNWFHFLIESLPSLLESIIENKINKNTVIVSGKLHINMLQVLHTLFDNQLNILQLDLMKAVYSENIFYIKSSFACHELKNGTVNSDYFFNDKNIIILRGILEKKLHFNNNLIKEKKLFVVRKSFQRNIVNINELILVAKNYGYEIIVPEALTFIEQVEIFSAANRIIGPTGAWLANILFVNNEAQVAVLNPNTAYCSNSIWKMLGKIVGVHVSDYYFEVIEKNEYQPIHSDFHVSLTDFEKLLNWK